MTPASVATWTKFSFLLEYFSFFTDFFLRFFFVVVFEVPEKPDAAAIRVALAGMGYGIDDLKKMDHHDIDDDFWKKLVTRKAYHKKSEKAARKQPDEQQIEEEEELER